MPIPNKNTAVIGPWFDSSFLFNTLLSQVQASPCSSKCSGFTPHADLGSAFQASQALPDPQNRPEPVHFPAMPHARPPCSLCLVLASPAGYLHLHTIYAPTINCTLLYMHFSQNWWVCLVSNSTLYPWLERQGNRLFNFRVKADV